MIDSPGEMAEEDSHASAPDPQDKLYKAHGPKVRPFHLKICRPGKGKESPSYHDLLHVRSNDAETHFEVIFRHLIIRVSGKNLGEVINAIENHVCDFIQEYHASLWPQPETGKAIIKKIEIPLEEPDKPDKAAAAK